MTPEQTLARLATACFLAGLTVVSWGALPAERKVRFARLHGIGPDELLGATRFLGNLMTQSACDELGPWTSQPLDASVLERPASRATSEGS